MRNSSKLLSHLSQKKRALKNPVRKKEKKRKKKMTRKTVKRLLAENH